MLTAQEALERLQGGNHRFVARVRSAQRSERPLPAAGLLEGQEPFAVVLGCSDSRVPAEIVFDQGFGDLFVIRVAGNVAGPSQIGSIEYAVEQLGVRLVVVLGHSHCGAVTAALEEIRLETLAPSPHLRFILDRVRPAVEPLMTTRDLTDPDDLLAEAVRANIRTTLRQLEQESEVLRRMVHAGDVLLIGAEYALQTGEVVFLTD